MLLCGFDSCRERVNIKQQNRLPTMNVLALIPAHNEEQGIGVAIEALKKQSIAPERIIVVVDNCTDNTASIARSHSAETFETNNNAHKKAGALNQAISHYIADSDFDYVLVQDADSSLDSNFIENALDALKDDSIGAVGGVFSGSSGGGFVGHLQRNEYARYARDVKRLRGKCLVVTGTAAIFRKETITEVSQARISGVLPSGDGRGGFYDTTVLTEDNEISFALMHLGYKILSPHNCTLVTEVMESWSDLWRQRLRWKRGALENCFQYGVTKVTWRYWGRQLFTAIGVLVTAVYLATVVLSIAITGGLHVQPFWAAVTAVFVLERIVTVRYRGWKYMLAAATMYELIIDVFLQAVHARAYFDVMFNRKKVW